MAARAPTTLVEDFRPFVESKLWELQRQYFAARGQQAWSAGEVPHYITSNPVVAAAYAEVLVAFRRDRLRRDPAEEALWIVELGAGSGRFAHHLLQQLAALCEREGLDPAGFRYVLSDFCAANLEAWAQQPRFVPLFASGQLERARFDVMDTSALELEHGGGRIGRGDLGAPLVVIANYLLDSIPADLLCFRQGQVERGLDGLLAEYQRQLAELEEAWLLLSADKGHHRLEEVVLAQPPALVTHGSFSLSVNYHALCGWAAAGGGQALVPDPGRGCPHTVALLRLPEADYHRATAAAWRRHLAAFGPGDYLNLSQLACANAEQLSAEQLLAFLRLGQGDSHLFVRRLPRLQQLAADLQPQERLGLLDSVAQVGRMQFPLDGREAEAMEEGCRALRQGEAWPQPPAPELLALQRELDWLAALVQARVERLFRRQGGEANLPLIPEPPPLPTGSEAASPWAELVGELAAEPLARLALALLLAAQLRPAALDPLMLTNPALERRFSECGGLLRESGFEPTGDTLALLADGGQPAGRLAVVRLLAQEGPLRRLGLLTPPEGDAPLKGGLRLVDSWLEWIAGAGPRPSAELAATTARRLTTDMAWQDLVLPAGTLRQLEEIETYLQHRPTLLAAWGMAKRLRPGYRALFHGPPGTGKTLTAALLGVKLGLEVRRVDLSQAVSKYIGETEKNLAAVLDRAEQRQWLLVFDEADALFGKRSETRDAHDRYANQEIAYLLQRLETFQGLVILATNLPANLDGAFLRRFESVVYFPMPGPEQRLRLWREAFSPLAQLEVDLEALAVRHELSGGLILNVVRRVSLQAIAAGGQPIGEADLLRAIRQELEKEGKGV